MKAMRIVEMALVSLVLVVTVVSLLGWRSLTQAVTYSGRAYGAQVKIVTPQPNVLLFSDTGNLPSQGGSQSASLATFGVSGVGGASAVSANAQASAGVSASTARQENVNLFPLQPCALKSTVVEANARADCAGVSGSSVVTGLTFAGAPVAVTGQANQKVSIPGVATLTINEQVVASGSITVNAIHLSVCCLGEDVVLSSAQSGINCIVPTRSSTWTRMKAIYR